MRCSYSCGVDHHPNILQEQTLAFRPLGCQDRELCRNLTVLSVTLLQLVVDVKDETSVRSVGCEPVRVLKMRTKTSNLPRHPIVDGGAVGHSGSGLRVVYLGCCCPVRWDYCLCHHWPWRWHGAWHCSSVQSKEGGWIRDLRPTFGFGTAFSSPGEKGIKKI